jgi:hypothetical protein
VSGFKGMGLSGHRGGHTAVIIVMSAVSWFALAQGTWAQETTGTLRGTVRDSSFKPLAGAVVTATAKAEGTATAKAEGTATGNLSGIAETKADGTYEIKNLRPGTYTVTVVRVGFKKGEDTSVVVTAKGEQVRLFDLEDKPPARQVRFWGGVNFYAMDDFNRLLATDRNRPVGSGFTAGAEVSLIATKVPKLGGTLHLPVGVEYLAADSVTTHVNAGGSATVIWDVPVVGLFVAPTLSLGKAERFYLHPGVGYYLLGQWQKAGLSVTDRSGRLAAKNSGPGAFAAVGLKQQVGNTAGVFVEGGYRYLKLTSIDVTPVGDFPEVLGGAAVRGGTLASPLDYSSFFLRFGFSLRLGPEASAP